MRIIALEEHFVSQAFLELARANLGSQDAVDMSATEVTDLGERRLADMDAAGIGLQVLSHVVPTFNPIAVDHQIEIAGRANDQPAIAVGAHPDRFAAFAALLMADIAAAVRELDRVLFSVDYPFCTNIHGRAFLDKLAISPADKAKLSHQNAENLLNIARN
jgi:predicted TIM-barrel fold metal-dependent hydrolase